ncbi:cytidine deaminase [Moorella thermoacetica]|uniref:Cytidine deaminase n=2 Tax=Neomoorella thermoacetica TaxID=1525 RepID=A0A1D7X8M3_NEOTH|nr:cytidine deaminase [Moorella thermoacetica]AKX93354.1 cytidine deaminase [Moorella thermoacetica]AKX95996.1 cytidine deaminase [Moorella thermoacetica]AOQ23263.1 Cytidine deaminase [Moorella thermoacetica]OIQ12030.1 cytidine deaminase [Moorella thermoacetica]OIQ56082.1 cytidine deaminase [Moorella thermoacetica]
MKYDLQDLIAMAAAARDKAYAPYSHFRVGAALLTAGGRVYTGCNIENASYGLTVCAERVALFQAVAAGEREFTALAVVGGDLEACFPCGACRQVLAEFAPDLEVITGRPGGSIHRRRLKELLPDTFTLK